VLLLIIEISYSYRNRASHFLFYFTDIKMQLVISAFTNISQKAFLFVMHKEERIANKINCCHGNVMPQQVKNAVLCTRKG